MKKMLRTIVVIGAIVFAVGWESTNSDNDVQWVDQAPAANGDIDEYVNINEPSITANVSADYPTTPDYNIDAYMKKFGQEAKLKFNPSEKMKVGVTQNISAYISENLSDNNNLEVDYRNLTAINITATPRMKVVLLQDQDGTFDIKSTTNDIQPIAKGVTEWEWAITPKRSGRYNLTLIAYVVFPNDDSDIKYSGNNINTFEELHENIEVETNAPYTLRNNWQWIAGVIIIPLIGALLKYLGKKVSFNIVISEKELKKN